MSAPDTRGLVLQLLVSLSLAQEQPWSPIVGSRGLSANQRPGSIRSLTFPPLLPASNIIVHSNSSPLPSVRTVTSDNSLPSAYHYDHRQYSDSGRRHRRTRPHYREPYRRNYRRRRRYYRVRDPRSRYRRVRSHSPASSSLAVTRERLEGRARSVEAESEGRGFVRSVRNLFGAQEHCLEGGRQYSCTLAPVCWMTGGVASPGDADDDNLDRDDDIDPDTVLVTRLRSV